jgi:TonB family protein
MNGVTEIQKPSPAKELRGRSTLGGLASRCSGTVASVALHSTFVFLAFLSVAPSRMGRGGGTAGSLFTGSGPREYSAQLRSEDVVDATRSADARLFAPPEPEPLETPEALPPPTEDFLKETSETGLPAPPVPPLAEPSSLARSRQAYEKLPPSSGSENGDGIPPTAKGDSTVNGSGGDTGGAGDGTSGALYMPAPDYPASARRKGIEGVVVIAVEVHSDGHCEHAQVAESSGCDALDDAALNAIRKWKYEVRPNEGPMHRRVRFVFKLQR